MMNRRILLALALPLLMMGLLTGCATKTSASGGAQTTSSSPASATSSGTSTGATTAGTTCPTSNTTDFAKTKFVLHTGLAFGAFHRYLYKPFRTGRFQSGAHGRIFAFVKAGAAALFIKREVRLASEDVKANPTLCKLIAAPLRDVSDQVSGALSALKGGDTSALTALEQTVQGVKGKASSTGNTIVENANPPLS